MDYLFNSLIAFRILCCFRFVAAWVFAPGLDSILYVILALEAVLDTSLPVCGDLKVWHVLIFRFHLSSAIPGEHVDSNK
ncbi:hypothetical protein BJY04DRAFT_198897 [Aspergillus karnatakaensis]|uniref:uncharacterized protein n=1 Tax=Aspergillus karnatakaensis TaxID=1810916 RepID=UPI003CCDAF28